MSKLPGYISKFLILDPTVTPVVTPPVSNTTDAATGNTIVYKTGGYTEVKGVGDMSFSAPQGEYDTTSHDTGQWKTSMPGRKDASVTCKMMYDDADPGQQMLLNAWEKARVLKVHFVMNTGLSTAKAYEGFAYINKFDLASPTDGICTMDLGFKFTDIVTVVAQPTT